MNVRRLSWCLFCVLCAVLLAACGDDSTPTPTPTVATATPVVATAAPVTPTAAPPAATAPPAQAQSPITAPAAAASGTAATGSVTATTPLSGAAVLPLCAIEPNPDFIGYADLEARLGCPIGDASNDEVAINEFGAGPNYDRFMLWFEAEAQIYVLLPTQTWLAYSDTWQEGDPELSCNPEEVAEPTSPPLPRRGFGKLWCNVESVRTAMGPIDREERLCQHAVAQRFDRGRLLACFEDATIRYFRILDDGTWDMEMVQ